jgi:S-adenosylmethionine hydrolase
MIAIFTDFGIQGPYLGQMKAVLYHEAPGAPVVDIFPDLPPYNVKAAAYLLPAYSQYLPENAVCLSIVDPGVGTERRALVVYTDQRWYVGPDNGLFSILIRRDRKAQVFEITWKPKRLSASFHGRDLFAPVAAHIVRGDDVPGEPLDVKFLVRPSWPGDLEEIVYIDPYGNAVTGVRAETVSRDAVLEVAGQRCGFQRVFGEVQPGKLFWYENSNGLVEIAVSQGSASLQLGLSVGSQVQLSRH